MADLGQTIVNRVKPLLDEVNSAGYRAGYDNGFDSGYSSGEENVRGYVDTQVERSKKAIIGRGGDISSSAGLEDLPNAIFNIPADASLAHYTDTEIAYRKSVPVGAEKYALLKSVGGMTCKSNNLIPYPYINKSYTISGITFTDNGDGTITTNGTATDQAYFILFKGVLPIGKYFLSGASQDGLQETQIYFSNGSYSIYKVDTGSGVAIDVTKAEEFSIVINILKGTVVNNAVFKPMLNEGTTALPHERYFEGLRDSKTTEIASHGANLFPILPWANRTISGVTFSLDENGVYHLSGAATETLFAALKVSLPVGKYTLSLNCNKQIGTGFANAVYVTARSADGEWRIVNSTHSSNTYITITTTIDIVDVTLAIMEGVNCDGLTIAPMLNKGDYIPYAPYRDEPIATKPIPKALQDIDGYGWGINADCYNYIDYEKKQFVKRVDRVQLEDLAWEYVSYNGQFFSYSYDLQDKIKVDYNNPPMIAENYNAVAWEGGNIGDIVMNAQGVIRVYTETANTKPSGTLYYGLAEPVITDISDILTDDNFLEVESGGTLEFVNEYKNAVPSTVKYTVKVGS